MSTDVISNYANPFQKHVNENSLIGHLTIRHSINKICARSYVSLQES